MNYYQLFESLQLETTNQSIIWNGAPNRKVYRTNQIWHLVKTSFGTFGLIFILYLWSLAVKSEFDWFSSSLFIGAITAIEIGLSIRRIKRLKEIHYIITSTHIICCDKSFKIKAIPISKVESIELIESYIEKKHDTCSISIFCGEKNYSDDGIENIKYNLTAISKTNSPYDLINSYILGKNTITKSNDVTRVI